jgi:hypothetical protein
VDGGIEYPIPDQESVKPHPGGTAGGRTIAFERGKKFDLCVCHGVCLSRVN